MSVSVMTRLAARLLGTAGAEGGPGSGRTPARPHMEPWRDGDEASNLDSRKLKKMEIDILQAERQNSQTREKSYDAMVNLIKKTITSIADRTY